MGIELVDEMLDTVDEDGTGMGIGLAGIGKLRGGGWRWFRALNTVVNAPKSGSSTTRNMNKESKWRERGTHRLKWDRCELSNWRKD